MSYDESEIFHPTLGRSDSFFGYKCGCCNHDNSGRVIGIYPTYNDRYTHWLLCTNCGQGSVSTTDGIIYPVSKFGSSVEGLEENLEKIYNEARDAYSIGAFTGCELICRKILMNVSVNEGAEEGKSFEGYLNFLKTKGHLTEQMMPWVSLIKKHGNLATHEITTPDKKRAESTLAFTEQLLKMIYEMKHRASKYTK